MINCKHILQPSWRFASQFITPSSTQSVGKIRHFSLVVETPTSTLNNNRDLPSHIARPHYAQDDEDEKNAKTGFLASLLQTKRSGSSSSRNRGGLVKSHEMVTKIRRACRIGRRVLNTVRLAVKAGVSTDDLDLLAHQLICQENAYPSPLRYQFFPKSICTSVNNVVVHGIPDSRKLEDGDIINVDISVFVDGFHGDLSETFLVGDVDEAGKTLVSVTRDCLDRAIGVCGPGQELKEIGKTICSIAHARGFTVCPHYVGHGIGEEFHEMPQILHHDNDYPGTMVPGMVFTIEPVLCEGGTAIDHWKDGWTVVTRDNKRAAQFEHTIHITDSGFEVLTKDDKDDDFLQPESESIDRIGNFLSSRI